MARLVDADVLMEHYKDMQGYERCACNFVDDGGEPSTEWYCVEDALENAPTIDAIPVEWIQAQVDNEKRAPLFRRYAESLLTIWQMEQEAQDG